MFEFNIVFNLKYLFELILLNGCFSVVAFLLLQRCSVPSTPPQELFGQLTLVVLY